MARNRTTTAAPSHDKATTYGHDMCGSENQHRRTTLSGLHRTRDRKVRAVQQHGSNLNGCQQHEGHTTPECNIEADQQMIDLWAEGRVLHRRWHPPVVK